MPQEKYHISVGKTDLERMTLLGNTIRFDFLPFFIYSFRAT